MKNYFGVLEVPDTATHEEIRLQYKQLVRIYHPDRFMNPIDKVYAEERLKEINEAYSILSNKLETGPTTGAPKPVVDPLWLDFGILSGKDKVVRSFQVENLGGPAKTIEFLYSENHAWFQIGNGRPVIQGKPMPVLFDITVDLHKLPPTQTHHAWVDIDMDGMCARLNLMVHVTRPASSFKFSRRLIVGVTLCFVILLATLFLQFGANLPLIGKALNFSTNLASTKRLQADHLLFSVEQNNQQMVYASQADGANQIELGFTGWSPSAAPNGQQITYVAGEEHAAQIFVSAIDGGHLQQVTNDSQPKSTPIWSPNGQMIAFLAGPDSQTILRIFDIQNKQFYDPPNTNLGFAKNFDWAPDGKTILFDAYLGNASQIYQFNPDSQDLHLFTPFDSWDPAWSPDGKRVAVTSRAGIFTLDSQGGDLQQITQSHGWSPAWSFDGRQIAFFSDKNSTSGTSNLWVTDADGNHQSQLPKANSLSFAWSPLSNRLAYVTGSAKQQAPILYLWVTDLKDPPHLVAEINQATIAWTH
ncbi:hypothetical protein BH10CHL1_BH10CHL1_20450 [soil metagenome]